MRVAASLRHSYFMCEACRRCEGCAGRHAALTSKALLYVPFLSVQRTRKPVESAGMRFEEPAAGERATRWRVGECEM